MKLLQRYDAGERQNHWLVALLFVMAALSGLAFFHPAFYFFANLFGGGSWARILHPFMGVLMLIGFFFMYRRYAGDNKMTDADREWRAKMGQMLKGDKAGMPPVGKYNAGQKMVFWVMTISLLVLLVTGLIFWRPYFAGYFGVNVLRAAVTLHAIAAVVLILAVIMHVYAAIWVKGTLRAMMRGTVTERWAQLNHPLWHREMTKK